MYHRTCQCWECGGAHGQSSKPRWWQRGTRDEMIERLTGMLLCDITTSFGDCVLPRHHRGECDFPWSKAEAEEIEQKRLVRELMRDLFGPEFAPTGNTVIDSRDEYEKGPKR